MWNIWYCCSDDAVRERSVNTENEPLDSLQLNYSSYELLLWNAVVLLTGCACFQVGFSLFTYVCVWDVVCLLKMSVPKGRGAAARTRCLCRAYLTTLRSVGVLHILALKLRRRTFSSYIFTTSVIMFHIDFRRFGGQIVFLRYVLLFQ